MKNQKLGVNIDHVATLRQARGTRYPSVVEAAKVCEQAGAFGITMHLREDRRHIQDQDVFDVAATVSLSINLEMAASKEMLGIATKLKPHWACLVPEKRQELTTEGGLDLLTREAYLTDYISTLQDQGVQVSLFIDPDSDQISAAHRMGANAIELHTGDYANCIHGSSEQAGCLDRLKRAAELSYQTNPKLLINAGHGLTLQNTRAVSSIAHINELNIGHALISDAVFMGLPAAVKAYIDLLN